MREFDENWTKFSIYLYNFTRTNISMIKFSILPIIKIMKLTILQMFWYTLYLCLQYLHFFVVEGPRWQKILHLCLIERVAPIFLSMYNLLVINYVVLEVYGKMNCLLSYHHFKWFIFLQGSDLFIVYLI